jgi:hypothetical protein
MKIKTGKVFGRLTVLAHVGTIAGRQAGYQCQCRCGEKKVVSGSNLRRGLAKSCGCLRKEKHRAAMAERSRLAPDQTLVAVWRNIVFRCTNKKSAVYYRYGGRGIKVCERWLKSARAFIEDMGPRPSDKHTVERINNEGNYEPGNCRWATKKEQARNKANNVRLTCDGRTMLMVEWAEETGIGLATLHARLKSGWSHEKTIKTPVRGRNESG